MHATAKLSLDWTSTSWRVINVSPANLLFLLDLHSEVLRSWGNPFSAHVFPLSKSDYVKGLEKHGYTKMSWMEESLAGYLSSGAASSWKPPAPSKPFQFTSKLVSKAYAVTGQVGGAVMAMLQAYKADFLKDVNVAGGVAPDTIEDLLHNTDLTLWCY